LAVCDVLPFISSLALLPHPTPPLPPTPPPLRPRQPSFCRTALPTSRGVSSCRRPMLVCLVLDAGVSVQSGPPRTSTADPHMMENRTYRVITLSPFNGIETNSLCVCSTIPLVAPVPCRAAVAPAGRPTRPREHDCLADCAPAPEPRTGRTAAADIPITATPRRFHRSRASRRTGINIGTLQRHRQCDDAARSASDTTTP